MGGLAFGMGLGLSARRSAAAAPTGVPVNQSAPYASGIRTAGQILLASVGSWTQSPTIFTYQWLRDGDPIDGETTNAYLQGDDDEGAIVDVKVTAANVAFGAGAPAVSESVDETAAALELAGEPDLKLVAGEPYSFIPDVTGGHGPFTFGLNVSLAGTGFTFNASNGELSTDGSADEQLLTGLVISVVDVDLLSASLALDDIAVVAPEEEADASAQLDLSAPAKSGFLLLYGM